MFCGEYLCRQCLLCTTSLIKLIIYPSIHPSVRPSVRLSIYLSIYLSISLSSTSCNMCNYYQVIIRNHIFENYNMVSEVNTSSLHEPSAEPFCLTGNNNKNWQQYVQWFLEGRSVMVLNNHTPAKKPGNSIKPFHGQQKEMKEVQ